MVTLGSLMIFVFAGRGWRVALAPQVFTVRVQAAQKIQFQRGRRLGDRDFLRDQEFESGVVDKVL
ncbi:MAG: hypothetical protein A2038_12055 [Deltaproteobacteria bacterium GWA2_57_13]|nr:MAG: hypothetical protein A2038_12055 [Deltaproteobacteria bacterium GWA2_57_13]